MLTAVSLLCSCTGGNAPSANSMSSLTGSESAQQMAVTGIELPAEPVKAEAEVSGELITLKGDTAETSSDGVTAENGFVTVTKGGTYTVTGSLTGQLRVNVTEEQKVTLVLNGACITSENSAAVFILSSPKKTVISTAAGSVNILVDGDVYDESICDESDGDIPDAALYSRDDLKLSGSGELYVQSLSHRGINCKDDLEIEKGSLFVASLDDALRGKDSISLSGGVVTLETEGNGLRSKGDESDATKGTIDISGGEISIVSGGDAVDAENALTVSGGSIAAVTGGGHENGEQHTDEFGGGMGGGMRPGGGGGGRPWGMSATTAYETATLATETETAEKTSFKGLKSAVSVTVTGGALSLDCADDTIHSDGSVTIENGSLYLQSGDDALHAETVLSVSGGVIEAAASYEGAEGENIIISGGVMRLTASDDGINAGVSTGGGGGFGGFGGAGSGGLTVTGGYTVLNASGDGLDSNNTVDMSGGTLIVYGPENGGNGPLDYQSKFTFTGGTLVAMGSSGMAQSVTNSGCGCVAFNLNTVSGGTLLNVADKDGNSLLCIENPKSYSSVVFASDMLTEGETYTVSLGGTHSGTAVDGVYSDGEYIGGEELGEAKA